MEALERAWENVVEVLPQIALFLVILIVGWIIASAVARLLDTLLDKIGFDRWVERGGIKRALARSEYDASDLLSKIVFYGLILVVLQMAFGVFGENPVSDLIEEVVAYLPKLFVAILIIVIAAYVAAAVRDIARASLGNLDYGDLLANIAYWAILLIGIFAALDQLEIAPDIVNGLFYFLLAVVGGSLIIALGGGGIQPMRQRWERWLARAEQEAPRIAREAGSEDTVRAADYDENM
ncbi:MAG: hypothetical protein KY394_01135 [Actinobacteria bacterium]|nr:hypothetical protein [Actinomycetota bacterium]